MLESKIISKAEGEDRSGVLDIVKTFTGIYGMDINNLKSQIDSIFDISFSSKVDPRIPRKELDINRLYIIEMVETYTKHREDYRKNSKTEID